MKFTLLFVLFSFPLFADDMGIDKETGHIVPKYVGELKSFRGKVYKKSPEGRKIEVRPGTRFYKNDTLATEDKSFAKLLIVDDTQMTLGPKSEINFAEFKFVSKTNRKILYSLVHGQLRGNVKNKAKEDDVIIKTKNATMGVRGTKILVNHQTLQNLEVSQFALESGSAEVKDNLKNIKHDLLKDDRVVVVKDQNSQASAEEKNKLTPQELEVLKDDEDFMPYFDIQNVGQGSPLYSLLHANDSTPTPDASSNVPDVPKMGPDSSGSFQNLDKLNQKLRNSRQNP